MLCIKSKYKYATVFVHNKSMANSMKVKHILSIGK